jgi:hypothetical protein
LFNLSFKLKIRLIECVSKNDYYVHDSIIVSLQIIFFSSIVLEIVHFFSFFFLLPLDVIVYTDRLLCSFSWLHRCPSLNKHARIERNKLHKFISFCIYKSRHISNWLFPSCSEYLNRQLISIFFFKSTTRLE